MEQLLSKAGSTLVTFAVRSGVQVASTYVIKSVSTLVDHVPHHEKKRLERKRDELQNKIEALNYSVGVIQLLSARGNSNLTSVLKLTDYLKHDIDTFTKDISILVSDTGDKKLSSDSIKIIDKLIDELMSKIDTLVPMLNLVLITYGTSSVNNFQDYVSPGKLLNSTVLVKKSNDNFTSKNQKETIVGPEFAIVLYNIFYKTQATGDSKIIWREKFARAKFSIVRIPNQNSEFAYEVRILEDFNDGRYHDEVEDTPGFKVFDIRQISKVFFSASGRLLKLSDKPTPVLVFKIRNRTKKLIDEKIDVATNKMGENESESDFEWIAVGDYQGDDDEENGEDTDQSEYEDADAYDENRERKRPELNPIPQEGSAISLLEYLIRLCTLQANDQIDILRVKDERLRLYLSDENYANNSSNQILSLTKKLEHLNI